MKTGLVMEGGAMRGMFTCGIIDVLMEQKITFDGAGGISAGAVFGCNFKSGQIGRPLRYNKTYGSDPRYCSLRSLITTGDLYGADFCYRELPEHLDVFDRKAFRENPMPFYVGATDMHTGKPVYHACMDGGAEDMLWMRASASMPFVSRPVQIGAHLLLDGGMTEPTPYFYMESLGYDRCLVILTQPPEYRKKSSVSPALIRLMLRRYPEAARAMIERPDAYNRHIAGIRQREKEGRVMVLCPPAPLNIARTEHHPYELDRVYQIGRRLALEKLTDIRAFLAAGTCP